MRKDTRNNLNLDILYYTSLILFFIACFFFAFNILNYHDSIITSKLDIQLRHLANSVALEIKRESYDHDVRDIETTGAWEKFHEQLYAHAASIELYKKREIIEYVIFMVLYLLAAFSMTISSFARRKANENYLGILQMGSIFLSLIACLLMIVFLPHEEIYQLLALCVFTLGIIVAIIWRNKTIYSANTFETIRRRSKHEF
jgi:hypothetical protein